MDATPFEILNMIIEDSNKYDNRRKLSFLGEARTKESLCATVIARLRSREYCLLEPSNDEVFIKCHNEYIKDKCGSWMM